MGRVGCRLWNQVLVRLLVPEAHAGRQPHRAAMRVPDPVRHAHLDLATALADRDVERERRRCASGACAHEIRAAPMDGYEHPRRSARVRAVRELPRLLRVPDGDGRRHQRRVFHRVQRDPERRGATQRLDPELHEVRGVSGVSLLGRVRVGPVRHRERIAGAARVVGVTRCPLRPVVVVEEVLVEEFTPPVGARARDENRPRVPDPAILQLRGLRRLAVQDRGTRAWRGAAVERALACPRRLDRHQRAGARKNGRRHSDPHGRQCSYARASSRRFALA